MCLYVEQNGVRSEKEHSSGGQGKAREDRSGEKVAGLRAPSYFNPTYPYWRYIIIVE
jgi:hypothetical protein